MATNYFVGNDGIKTTINDDLFDLLWNSFESDDVSTTDSDSSEIIKKQKKKVYNDRLNEKNKNEGYFNDYFKKNNKCFECERCGKTISSTSNKAKHQNSERCKRVYEDRKQKEIEDKIIMKVLHG